MNHGVEIIPIKESSHELKVLLSTFLEHGFGILKYAQNEGVSEILPGLGITLFRKDQFQIQQFVFRPNTEIIEHAHPNVESVEMYICGDMRLTLNGKEVFNYDAGETKPDGTCPKNGGLLYLPAGAVHGGSIGPRGGCFLSLQYWINGKPKPIHLDWAGTDGSKHG